MSEEDIEEAESNVKNRLSFETNSPVISSPSVKCSSPMEISTKENRKLGVISNCETFCSPITRSMTRYRERNTPLKNIVNSPKTSGISDRQDDPETPKSEKSYKLSKRRKQSQKAPSKISPGLFILSDSEPEILSPVSTGFCTPQALSDETELKIVDVCSDKDLFKTFVNEWKVQKHFSLALACFKMDEKGQKSGGIGAKLVKRSGVGKSKKSETPVIENFPSLAESNVLLAGIAISWEACNAYYIAFGKEPWSDNNGKISFSITDPLSQPTRCRK